MTTDRLTPEIERTGTRLRQVLQPILEEAAGLPPRPGVLGQKLGIDKSLASRMVRALRGESDLELVHRIPSPTGLRMVLQRARQVGLAAARPAAVEAEIDRFDSFLRATPGGKDAIDAHISEFSQDVRTTREASARQAAHKAMSFLLGYYCETLTSTLILVPGKAGRSVDGIEVHQRVGMRRLRPHTPLALLSIMTPPDKTPRGNATWIEPLHGDLTRVAPSDFILPEFSTTPIPKLEILTEGGHTTFVLEDARRFLTRSLTLTSAFRIRNGWPLHQSRGVENGSRGYVLHTPAKMLVRDLFIAEAIYPGAVPDLDLELQSPGGRARSRPRGLSASVNSLDLHVPVEHLRPGPRGFALAGSPHYGRVLAHVFERTGHDPSRFRGFRCATTYPVPLVEMAWWWTLPQG